MPSIKFLEDQEQLLIGYLNGIQNNDVLFLANILEKFVNTDYGDEERYSYYKIKHIENIIGTAIACIRPLTVEKFAPMMRLVSKVGPRYVEPVFFSLGLLYKKLAHIEKLKASSVRSPSEIRNESRQKHGSFSLKRFIRIKQRKQ